MRSMRRNLLLAITQPSMRLGISPQGCLKEAEGEG